VYAAIFIDAIMVKVRDGQGATQPSYAAIVGMQRAVESRLRATLETYHPAPLHLLSSLDRDPGAPTKSGSGQGRCRAYAARRPLDPDPGARLHRPPAPRPHQGPSDPLRLIPAAIRTDTTPQR
jgi:hypothetical protein